MKLISIVLILLGVSFSQADMVPNELLQTNEEDAVIDNQFLKTTGLEEPVFSSQPTARDLASFEESGKEDTTVFIGQLSVLKEIPYTYPVSRHYIEVVTLNELEAKEKKRK